MSQEIRRITSGYDSERGHWAECVNPATVALHCANQVDAANCCASFVAGKLKMHFVQIEHQPPGDTHLARFSDDLDSL